ncbi:MAG: cytochrome c [Rhodothermales bacterium]|nr:cytochrome c [Rhodothermales bacterium]
MKRATHLLASLLVLGGAAGAVVLLTAAARMDAAPPDGEKIYVSRCMSCHQQDGQGMKGVFPPLAGTDWVVDDKGRLIRIVLQGMSGETEVQGVVYSGAMPAWGGFLSDDETAALLTYIRGAWGNDADAVTPAEVAAVRKATQDRKKPWTAAELKQEKNSGIPGAAAPFPNFLQKPDSTGR